jgi:hypothetical protein
MLDQVAAKYELEFQAVEVICVGKAQAGARTRADIRRTTGRATFEARDVTSGSAAGPPCARAETPASAFVPMPNASIHRFRCMISSHDERDITEFPIGRPMLTGCSSWVNI